MRLDWERRTPQEFLAWNRGAHPSSQGGMSPVPAGLGVVAVFATILWCLLYFLPPFAWALGIPLYVLFVWSFEQRRCRELRLDQTAAAQLMVGGVVGALEIVGPFGFVALAGHMTLQVDAQGLVLVVASAALGPLAEEPLARGVVLRYLELLTGSWTALFVTSAGATVAHLAFGPASVQQLTGIALGMFAYGAAYLLTRRLWLPLGMHVAYNVVLELLSSVSFTVTSTEKSVYWIVALLAGAIMVAVLVVLTWRRGLFVSRGQAWAAQTTGSPPRLTEAPEG